MDVGVSYISLAYGSEAVHSDVYRRVLFQLGGRGALHAEEHPW